MTDDETERRIRAALDAIARNTPDGYRPPRSFWERIDQEAVHEPPRVTDLERPTPVESAVRRPRPTATTPTTLHRAGALFSAAAVVAVATLLVQPWSFVQGPSSSPQAPAAGPTTGPSVPPDASGTCPPGPLVHPARSPRPAADTSGGAQVSAPPELRDLAGDDTMTLESEAFEPLTGAGGCVRAYLLVDVTTAPADTTRIPGAPMHARSRDTPDGITQVFISHDDGPTYVIISGNVGPEDLAVALAAALTRP